MTKGVTKIGIKCLSLNPYEALILFSTLTCYTYTILHWEAGLTQWWKLIYGRCYRFKPEKAQGSWTFLLLSFGETVNFFFFWGGGFLSGL